jgi:hypothetical protein
MTRVTIALTTVGLATLFVAFFKGVGAIHGGDVVSHMYWATAALFLVSLSNLIAIAHLGRAERIIAQLRALCDKNAIAYGDGSD